MDHLFGLCRFIKPNFRKWQQVEYEEVETEGEESGGEGRESDTKSRENSGPDSGEGSHDSDTERSHESHSGSPSEEDEDAANRIAFSFQSDRSIAWASSLDDHRGIGRTHGGGASDEDWNLGAMSISPPVGLMRMPPVLPVKSRIIPTTSKRKVG